MLSESFSFSADLYSIEAFIFCTRLAMQFKYPVTGSQTWPTSAISKLEVDPRNFQYFVLLIYSSNLISCVPPNQLEPLAIKWNARRALSGTVKSRAFKLNAGNCITSGSLNANILQLLFGVIFSALSASRYWPCQSHPLPQKKTICLWQGRINISDQCCHHLCSAVMSKVCKHKKRSVNPWNFQIQFCETRNKSCETNFLNKQWCLCLNMYFCVF